MMNAFFVVLFAFFARRCPAYFTAQVAFQGILDGPTYACRGLNAKLIEEFYCPPAHASSQHDIRILLVYKPWYLAGLVVSIKGIIDDIHSSDFIALHIHQGKEWAAPKVLGYNTFKFIIGFY
jgi:hypothetical protein